MNSGVYWLNYQEKGVNLLNMEEPLLTRQEVADFFNVGTRTVFNWMQEGMPHLRIGPRLLRFEKKQIEIWYKHNMTSFKDK